MKKLMRPILFLAMSVSLLCSCMSQEEKTKLATSEIKQDMIEAYASRGYTLHNLSLFHKEGDEYGGTVQLSKDGQVITYKVNATWNSSKFNWETY